MARPKDPALERARREQVLDATISLLEEGSWHGTSLAAVAKRAEVSKGVVTYWFPDKDSLILAAIDRYHDGLALRMAEVAQGPVSIGERVDTLLEIAFPSVEAVVKEIAFQAEVLSYAKAHPEVSQRVRDAYRAFRAVTAAIIMLGQVEGFVVDPPEGLPRMVHALIDGLSFQIAADPTVDIVALRRELRVHLERWFRPVSS